MREAIELLLGGNHDQLQHLRKHREAGLREGDRGRSFPESCPSFHRHWAQDALLTLTSGTRHSGFRSQTCTHSPAQCRAHS